jgi:isopentenyl-diphosphate delta-isomerase
MKAMTNLIPAWVDGQLQPHDKMAVHLGGLRHKAVSVFVISADELLIQRRAMGKYHTPGLWANTCCTHPDWGEAPVDCAVRRLREELGVEGLTPQHRGKIEYRADVGGGMVEDEIVDVFSASATPALPITPNPDEVMQARWIRLGDLQAEIAAGPDRFTPWLRIYLAEHLEQILGN